jgi:hypothetical protein
VPFSLSQVFLPDGAVHRTSGHSLSRKNKVPSPPRNRLGTRWQFLGEGGGGGRNASSAAYRSL